MYEIENAEVVAAIESNSRTFRALIEFADGSIVSGADIGTADIEHITADDGAVTFGNIISKRVEIKLYCDRKIRRGEIFRLYLYLLDFGGTVGTERATHRMLRQWKHRELSLLTQTQIAYAGRSKNTDGTVLGNVYIPMGEFAAVKCTIEGLCQTVTAYDKLAFADKPYVPAISFPADVSAVTDDILRQLNIAGRVIMESGEFICAGDGAFICAEDGAFICSEEYSFFIPKPSLKTTCRELLGYIAAMYGRNGILDRNGAYTTFFIGSSGTAYDRDKLDEPSLAENNVSVSGISCEVSEDTVLTAGEAENVYTVSIICPYMTEERLEQLWSEMRYLSWRPADASERLADPRRDIGDLMYYDSSEGRYRLPVTSLTFHFNGGLSADVSSCGQVETDEAENLFVMTSTIADMELLTIAELETRTIAEIQG